VGKSGKRRHFVQLKPKARQSEVVKDLVATHISFSSIQPSDLVDVVRKSCLVVDKMIFEQFEAQALSAQKELKDVHFSKWRAPVAPGIRVLAAGTDAVNGFYEEDGEFVDDSKYTKKCLWKGEARTLVI